MIKEDKTNLYYSLFCILSSISLLSDYECHGKFAVYIVSIRGSPIGSFNPAIPTKIFPQSRNHDGFYQLIPIPITFFKLNPLPQRRKAFSVDPHSG